MADGAGATPEPVDELGASYLDWVRDVTGESAVRLQRRSGGGSRAGFAVEVDAADGTTSELWLRSDTGAGPQSHGHYTVRREASVYRAVRSQGLRVAEVLAVHPTADAFLMTRLYGRNWFSEVTDPDEQQTIAREFMGEVAALHRIDARQLDLPELGPVTTIQDHLREEIEIWEGQYRAQPEPEPVIELALAWIKRELPPDGDWPVVLAQGDTGPGNFMFDGGHLVAVTDWEMAHYGDLHDDLAWIYVHDLQERLGDMPQRLLEYEAASGYAVDPGRLRYFLVLAQGRCAIGTRGGLLKRDSRGEIGAHLIYTTLHQRALGDALALATGASAEVELLDDPGDAPSTWIYDVALEDLRERIVPAISDGFASRRAKSLARLVKYLREQDRLGPLADAAERADLADLLGGTVDDLLAARRELCRRIRAHEVDDEAVVVHCVRELARRTQVLRPSMGALADRRYSPLP